MQFQICFDLFQVIQSTVTEKKGSKVLPVETIQSLLYKNLPSAESLNKSDWPVTHINYALQQKANQPSKLIVPQLLSSINPKVMLHLTW